MKLSHGDLNPYFPPPPQHPYPTSTDIDLSINDSLYIQKYYNNTHLKYCCLFSFFLPNVKIFFFVFAKHNSSILGVFRAYVYENI